MSEYWFKKGQVITVYFTKSEEHKIPVKIKEDLFICSPPPGAV